MANLGFVGLGVMGSRMAKRLLDAGHSVTGYNRTKSKAQWLLDLGMKWADTPARCRRSERHGFLHGRQHRSAARGHGRRGRNLGRAYRR